MFGRKGKSLYISAEAEADHLDPAEAFEHVLLSVRQQGWKGKHVVVLTPSAMNAIIELPVSAKKPKPVEQMHELVRWEVEPLLMQHQAQWTLGFLLELHGMLSHEQIVEINDIQKRQAKNTGAPRSVDRTPTKRFGELAMDLGYVSREQVQSLFVVQDWLRDEDDEVQCGWSAQGEVDDAPGVWNWLVSAAYSSSIQKWTTLCDDHDLTLLGLMPLTGNSLALLEQTDKSALILETSSLTTTAVRLHRQNVVSVRHLLNHTESMLNACLEAYHSENLTQHPAILLSCPTDNLPDLQAQFKEAIGHEVSLLPSQNPEYLSPGVMAAARHIFNLKGGKRISLIRQGGPLPPPLKRQENQAALLVGGLIALILVAELVMFIQHNNVSKEKAEIDARAKVLDDAVARINAQREEIDKRQAELEAQQESQRRMESRLDFFGQEMPERSLMVQAVLGIIQNTVNEQIIINRIDEMGRRVGVQADTAPTAVRPGHIVKDNFNIDAWALTESAGQEFVQNMKLAVAAWDMEVRDIQVFEKIGPMNMSGYSVSMSILHVVPIEEEAP
ncbi:hypothetical protein Q7C_264 [Methylophaga frappieri]|uniref:Uncharacterized protein n=1 Tax=Methylophaga frappieri (strain ATCC BAA-2434 / DSM 25690 / JAM7) TaxID=754477 RepID=I1YEV0_METFJ|nr:hypothetical protein Q7C_264 [Methylophaga frappieri]